MVFRDKIENAQFSSVALSMKTRIVGIAIPGSELIQFQSHNPGTGRRYFCSLVMCRRLRQSDCIYAVVVCRTLNVITAVLYMYGSLCTR